MTRRCPCPTTRRRPGTAPAGEDIDLLRRAAVASGARIVTPGSPGSQIIGGLLSGPVELDAQRLLAGELQEVGEREMVLFKPRWSAFYRTGLDEWLRDQGCDTVVVGGCNLPNCPRATLFDASERDFRAVVLRDAVSRASIERITDLEEIGVQPLSASDVVAALGQRGTPAPVA
ncbi:cysteine hydrolase family protein [Leekyejoonella antrihumi]|uniref:cysteine hydrolase family protein n=1 Tax=Leekyejoonella antrihumi TaxID=1660198 RepID=UPI001FE7D4B3|nr:isochorismatase family protein [Leekyejoonella antrihumi]